MVGVKLRWYEYQALLMIENTNVRVCIDSKKQQ